MGEGKGILIFKVDLGNLMKESAMALGHGAGIGLTIGFQVALAHLQALTEIAIEKADPGILLRLYALGLVDNPIPHCKERGTWGDEYVDLATKLGLEEVANEASGNLT